ncbi:HEXXH motif domain-containing protein [Streptosporangiaceae bacterium NEAU-GS5]|nr:HEXXH motif domain-containing protein [Streptosporangiaceae bacterium NEAU-GS5]
MILTEHQIAAEEFADLAGGGGGAPIVERLATAQYSKHMLLVKGVLDAARRADHPRWGQVRMAYRLLAAIQPNHPEAVAAVLRHPSVGAWTRHTIRTLDTPEQLACLAAAAAIRAGFECEVDVPVTSGVVTLPSLGQARVAADRATVHCYSGGAEVSAGRLVVRLGDESPDWDSLRALQSERAGVRLGVLIDDLDPHRMPGSANLGGRLPSDEAHLWGELLDEAWEMLVDDHRRVAEEVAAAITVFTPLNAPPLGVSSATSRETFGCVALSTPPDAHALAVTLAHETQHAKLSALLDIVQLTKPDDGSRHYAPWRDDPRPAGGLLQGAYAYLGVTEFWRRRRHLEKGEAAIRAGAEFARWRSASYMVSQTLLDSGRLTSPGQVFVSGMADRLAAWQAEPLPAACLNLAKDAADRHRSLWRERNA